MKACKRTIGMFLSRYGVDLVKSRHNDSTVWVYKKEPPTSSPDLNKWPSRKWAHLLVNRESFVKVGIFERFHFNTNEIELSELTEDFIFKKSSMRLPINDELFFKVNTSINMYLWPNTLPIASFITRAGDIIRGFDALRKSRAPVKHTDMFRYSSWSKLQYDMEKAELYASKRSIKRIAKAEGLKCIINWPSLKVYQVLTHEGACIIGKGTRWCISSSNSISKESSLNSWTSYRQNDIFVVIENKRKTAVVVGTHPDNIKMYDAADKEISDRDLMQKEWRLTIKDMLQAAGIKRPRRRVLRAHEYNIPQFIDYELDFTTNHLTNLLRSFS